MQLGVGRYAMGIFWACEGGGGLAGSGSVGVVRYSGVGKTNAGVMASGRLRNHRSRGSRGTGGSICEAELYGGGSFGC